MKKLLIKAMEVEPVIGAEAHLIKVVWSDGSVNHRRVYSPLTMDLLTETLGKMHDHHQKFREEHGIG